MRLLLQQASRWIDGESEFSSYQRVFHYDVNQLVGVIFGARMSDGDKAKVKEILDGKLSNRGSSDRKGKQYLFDFMYQQASICPSSRKVQIKNIEINSLGSVYKPDHKEFNQHYIKWLLGVGMTYDDGRATFGPIP